MNFPFGGIDESWAITPISLDAGGVFEVRKLSGQQLDTAREKATAVKQRKAFDALRELGADGMNMLNALPGTAPETKPDPLDDYDAALLVRFGVVGWDIKHPVTGEPIPCDEEWKSRLDADTRDEMARGVLSVNVRPKGEGNGSGRS